MPNPRFGPIVLDGYAKPHVNWRCCFAVAAPKIVAHYRAALCQYRNICQLPASIVSNTLSMNQCGTCLWNRSLIEFTNIIRGRRHDSGWLSLSPERQIKAIFEWVSRNAAELLEKRAA